MTDTYVIDSVTGKAVILKDPLAVLDYTFDWTSWLDDVVDTIASAVITITAAGSLIEASHNLAGANKKVVVWLSGGVAGTKYQVDCKITTNSTPSRTDSRSIFVKVKDR